MQEFSRLADDMMQGRPTESGPTPPNMIKNQWSFLPPVIIDTAPISDLTPHLHPQPHPTPLPSSVSHPAAALKTGSVPLAYSPPPLHRLRFTLPPKATPA